MKIAFLYLSQPYECYHIASVASALAQHPDVQVVEYYLFDDVPEHLRIIREALNAPALPAKKLKADWKAAFLRPFKNINDYRLAILNQYTQEFEQFDALLSTEFVTGLLKDHGLISPKLIWMAHGAGDRYIKREYLVSKFDLVALSGPKLERYYLKQGLVKTGNIRVVGYPKFDVFEAVRQKSYAPFPNGHPFILYNPHYKRGLSSYEKYVRTVVAGIKQQSRYNLIVAPHIEMFDKKIGLRKHFLKRLEGPQVLADTGSPRMLDMTYTAHAAIYLGDISSQVYEFLLFPRPCVFLNAAKVAWRDNPAFRHWAAGEVVDRPEDVLPAIARAQERHAEYKPAQETLFRETFGDLPPFGASERAATAIVNYMSCAAHV
ncbi:hypothetical protein AA0472_0996 [Acetobacter estunensis NRIC 0472]|uniref:Glycerophosphotransferase n=1 Tax=Acetobacter estunensis TaxID=104097 RepID=A0A967B4J9_9PROT|nr:hypothetical protein [Acetobacter estunensis]NHO52725.1 hypothetical protein [Acetobacter estunensis]GBQ23133.1 hypothetical protein AA0472_0996 [Acetobacter estunensis NRIC 0472]